MTREDAIQRLYELQFYSACKADERASMADIWREYVASIEMAISALMEQEERTSPCDLCRYNPPSSFDGKPCTMCPASPKEEV